MALLSQRQQIDPVCGRYRKEIGCLIWFNVLGSSKKMTILWSLMVNKVCHFNLWIISL